MVNKGLTKLDTFAEGKEDVPVALRVWFVIHFAVDMIVALPLFFAPREVLGFFGWIQIDPIATRLAAAALSGIGLESLLGRNAGPESFKGMLQLKIIWSAFATIGLAWSTLEGNLKYQLLAGSWLESLPRFTSFGGIGC